MNINQYEITNFFETLYNNFNQYYDNNKFYKIQYYIKLINNIFLCVFNKYTEFNIILKLNIPNFNISGDIDKWKIEYKLFRNNIDNISYYFSSSNKRYEIFKLIQELVTNNNKISMNYFENKLDLNKFYIYDETKKMIITFYVGSLNILLQQILSLYYLDYDIYIKEHNYYNKYYNDCTKIINKYKKNSGFEIINFEIYNIKLDELNKKIITEFNSNFENDFNDDKHYKFLINEWNYNIIIDSYNLYSELYDYLQLHLIILQKKIY